MLGNLIVPGAVKRECQVEAEGGREGQERQRGKKSGQAVQASGALAVLTNLVECRGGYEQANMNASAPALICWLAGGSSSKPFRKALWH